MFLRRMVTSFGTKKGSTISSSSPRSISGEELALREADRLSSGERFEARDDHVGVARIKLDERGASSGLFRGEKRRSASAEWIEHEVVRYRRVFDRASDESDRLHRRMFVRPSRTIDQPEVALRSISERSDACSAFLPAVPDRFVLRVVVLATEHERVLAPDDRARPVPLVRAQRLIEHRILLRAHGEVERNACIADRRESRDEAGDERWELIAER